MTTLEIINSKKEKTGKIELADSLLETKPNKAVLYQALRRQLASTHHGTVNTKTRSQVLRTGKKAYRQKGTGFARHGSRKSPPFVGGGRIFGPHPRDHAVGMSKKVRGLAIREALRVQISEGKLTILENIPLREIKTRLAVGLFSSLGIEGGVIILDKPSEVIEKSLRNVCGFKVICIDQLNILDLLKYPKIIFTSQSFKIVQEKYLMEKTKSRGEVK